MGLDVGHVRIGVATSDLLGLTARPLEVIKRDYRKTEFERIKSILKQYEIKKIVVGLPLNMDGTEGEQSEKVREFADILKENNPEIEIVFWDERLTSWASEEFLISAGVKREKRKKHIDKIAATFILQGYLDSNPDLSKQLL